MDVYGSCPPPPLHCSFPRALRLRWLHLPGRAPFRILGLPRDWSALFTVPHCVCILTVALRTRGNDSNAEVLQLRRCEFWHLTNQGSNAQKGTIWCLCPACWYTISPTCVQLKLLYHTQIQHCKNVLCFILLPIVAFSFPNICPICLWFLWFTCDCSLRVR